MKKINIHFLVFFIITCSVFIADYFVYFLKFDFILTTLGITFLNTVFGFFLIKKDIIKIKSDFSKFDFIFILGLLVYMGYSIVFPDLSWDTRSYHIYIQENTFFDKINFDFFAGRNLNTFLFPLGDRVNYIFRDILGYRLGTIMSYYVILILYYQIKKFLKEITQCTNKLFLSISSIFPCMMSVILAFSGTYYIDNYSLIILMEIFYILLFEDKIFEEKIKLYMLAILVGFSISIKITNIIFVIPIFLYFLIKNFKNINKMKVWDYPIVIILAVIPWGLYCLDNYMQTNNPVFPYYNNIFKSEYFMELEWKDSNFGPENIFQFIFWPIYIIFNPARAFDTKYVDLIWGIGFIVDAGYIISCILRKNIKQNKVLALAIVVFVSYYLWEKLIIGYVRYAAILLVLSFILIIYCIYKQYKNKKWISILLSIIVIFATLPSAGYDFLINIKDYEKFEDFCIEYKNNIKLLFKDKYNEKNKNSEIILGAIGDDSLIPTLIRANNRIYNLEEWVTITNDKTKNMYNEKILNKDIYVYCDDFSLNRKKTYLQINGFDIKKEEIVNEKFTFLSPTDKMYLLVVNKKQ